MKIRKAIAGVFLIAAVFTIVVACDSYVGTYTFRQKFANVEKIEFCAYEHATQTRTPILEVTGSEAETLFAELSSMACHELFPGDHPRDYGEIVICIHYSDGVIDVVGLTNIGWITPEGEWHLTKYTFEWTEMRDLVERYVPTEYLPKF